MHGDISDLRLTLRDNHKQNTVISLGSLTVGDDFAVIAGPCSVEGEGQISTLAHDVKSAGANALRGGAFKPRTSPYDFDGLHGVGLEYLTKAGKAVGLPTVSEITDISELPLFCDVDIIQIGARNMQNYTLLRALGSCGKPVLLKRGLSATIYEFLQSAEYIMASGEDRVILCERGIRTFETSTRATLDISAVPVLKKLTHLPVIVDPSHAAGDSSLVLPLACAAAAAGADGIMIEVHNDPENAITDGKQAVTPDTLSSIISRCREISVLVKP